MTDWTLFGAAAVLLAVGFVVLSRRGDDPADLVDPETDGTPTVPPVLLLVNVVVVNAVVGGLLVGAAWAADVPASAFGGPDPSGPPNALGAGALLAGIGLGVALYLGGELGGWVARALGREPDASAREALAPDSRRGWVFLLVVVLPLGAASEELLFRGALVGAFAA